MPHKDKDVHNDYLRRYIGSQYHKRRAYFLDKMGGECVDCKSTESLQFDHIDPTTKKYSIAKIMASYKLEKIEAELKKCQLLCKECHLEKSIREGSLARKHRGSMV